MTIRLPGKWTAAAIMLASAGFASTAMGADTSGTTTAPTTTTTATTSTSAGQTSVANRVAAPFSYFAGSPENAVALANALRTGTTASLTFATTATNGTDNQPTTTDISVPTKPMGWGNVSHALALAQFSLHQAGIDQPTAAQLQAALDGGAVTNATGQTTTLTGVLQQRANGMGWGQIAQSYGTTMGAVNHGIRTSFATTTAPTSPSVSAGATTIASPRSVTTASGTTAAGPNGVVTGSAGAQGQGNAYGRGIVTAGGAASSTAATMTRGPSTGVVTGNGAAAAVANAGSGNGGAHGGGNGNGKGKGGGG